MFTLFVAGGIGSGKSTVAKRIARLGGVRIDLDELARECVAPGSKVLTAVAERFGADLIDETGELKRALLAERAFVSAEATADLEAIEHPAIRRELRRRIAAYAGWGFAPTVCVVEVPLLDRVLDLIPMADEVLCVVVPYELRRERAIARGMSAADFEQRLARQPEQAFLDEHADCRIINDGTMAELEGKVDIWWERHVRRGWAPSAGEVL